MWQYVLVSVIVIVALTYATKRVSDALKGKNDPCEGCQMKKNCQKFCQYKEK